MVINGRTDLASEVRRRLCGGGSVTELPGVRAREETLEGFPVTTVEILDERGRRALDKPEGTYVTMELPPRLQDCLPSAARTLSALIRRCAGSLPPRILLAGLGNPDITPDALGSLAAGQLLVTEHLKRTDPETFRAFRATLLCRPGVLGTSGVESARQIRALCRETRPDLVIAIDALAGADLQLLCRSVQICNTGISPGSGVGNCREALDRESLGLPVLAVGVPTVADAASLSAEPGLRGMFVTPRSIDSMVRFCARLIAWGLNLALHEGLSMEEMQTLLDS
jgi:spore protease